jgi:hypothetical protein
VRLKRTKHTLNCRVTGHLSWAPSEVTCRNEEHDENAEDAGNIDSLASGEYAHLGLNQCVCGVYYRNICVASLNHQGG